MRYFYIIVITFSLFMSSCRRDSVASIASSTISLTTSIDVSETRVSVSGDSFVSGDRIGFYLAEVGRSLSSSGNAINNHLFTFDGSSWSVSGSLDGIIPSGSYVAYGYYPHNMVVSDAHQVEYSIKTSQIGGVGAADYLAWGRIKSGNPIAVDSRTADVIDVELSFINRLAYVTIKGNLPATYNNRAVGDVTGVKLLGAVKDCKLDLATGKVMTNPYADRVDIAMYKGSYDGTTKAYSYNCLAIPDTIYASHQLAVVEFAYNDGTGDVGQIYVYAPPMGTSFIGNTRHTITSSASYLDCYTEFVFAQAGGTMAADIKSSDATVYTLSVKTGADWITISGSSGAGYSVVASANTTTLPRIGELILSNGVLTRSIAVLQHK